MADRYFDWDRGSDSNDGLTPDTPKKTYSLTGTAAGDNFYFRRGTIQIVATQYQGVRIGTSAVNRSRYGVYGEAQVDWAGFRAGHSFGDMILNLSGSKWVDFYDLRFDCTGVNKGTYVAAQGSTAMGDVSFTRSHWFNSNDTGCTVIQESTATAQPSNTRFYDCEFYANKAHGLGFAGTRGARVERCIFRGNGFDSAYGGHGLTARFSRTEPSGGWTSMGGGVYRRLLGAAETTVYHVHNNVGSDTRMTQNVATPTTPSSGQWGQDSGYLYVHVGGADPGANVSYAWGICDGIIVIGCEAYDNVWDRDYIYHEGHGIAFDDWTQDSAIIGCKSYNNQGLGFSINRGDRNIITGCVAYGNWRAGLAINGSARDNKIYTSTFANNALGTDPLTSEISVSGSSSNNNQIKNCVIQGSVLYGIDFNASASGCVADFNAIRGYSDAVRNGTETNTIITDPLLDASYRPLAGSPCIGAGVYIPGAKHMGGMPMNASSPDIGAYRYHPARNLALGRAIA